MDNYMMNMQTPGTPEALNALLEQIAAGTAPGSADPAAAAQQDEEEAAAQGQAGDYAAQRWYEQTAAAYRAAAALPPPQTTQERLAWLAARTEVLPEGVEPSQAIRITEEVE